MIPISLKLSNFTSYGEDPPELDFRKFKLAAISGLNGAGKSSLLDAITWGIWGVSRAGDSSDSLVHTGADNMQVEFSFDLDGHKFTIKRMRSKKSGGSTALEFWSGSHNLTEGTIKATQEKIIDTLHLSFETFTNSAYLRQGHADEFTTKGPTDRKRILSDILGLSNYDRLEEKAKEKSKDIQIGLDRLAYQLLEIEAELSQKEEREKSLSNFETEAARVETELKATEDIIKKIDEEKQIILQTIHTLEEKRSQIDIVTKELQDLKIQIELKEQAKNEFLDILKQKDQIEKNYKELLSLLEDKKTLETKRSELIKLKDEVTIVQRILVSREEKRALAIKELEIEVKKFQTENEQLQNQTAHLETHKTVCPTCNQTIDDKKNKEIVLENKKKTEKNTLEIKNLSSKIITYTEITLPEEKQTKILDEQIKTLEEQTKDWLEITKQIHDLEKYTDYYLKLQQAQTAVKTHEETLLDLQKIYQNKKNQITDVEQQLKELMTFKVKLQEIIEKLRVQEILKQDKSQKVLELRTIVGEAKQLVSQTQQLENLQKSRLSEKEQLQKDKQIFDELALAFGKKGIQAMIIEAAIPEIEDESNNLLDKLTEGRMKISIETQRETKTKMTDGEKGIVETLDIIISDEMGERPYEMYSGGETFRVNFAIRLAISKLLTNRAGAKLQFLVIDEGFGSQDAPGRAKLVEAIDTIQNDFEKILVITHIEELKDEFPIRIEVSKNAGGSTFKLVGL